MMDEDDKFLILASDGVWEFLSNDEVLDLVVPFWHQNDLKGACNTIVKESVAAWEAEERKMSTTLRVEMCASLAMAAWMESWAAMRLNWISWL